MSLDKTNNYKRIEESIKFIVDNFKNQPTLDEIAAAVHLSPAHFQRIFTEWVGTSPKKFLQYISINYAKHLLSNHQATLFDTAFEVGFSSTSRLHDLFIKIEGMTPAEYKNGGADLLIYYNFAETPFGKIIIANTEKGICFIAFEDEENEGFKALKNQFPNAKYIKASNEMQLKVLKFFEKESTDLEGIKLHLKGTDFQIKVWESLLKIPSGEVSTYGNIANKIGQQNAARAVGTAIGSNPIAYLIPCHRVIQSSGKIGGYMWNPIRKTAILGWEAAQKNLDF